MHKPDIEEIDKRLQNAFNPAAAEYWIRHVEQVRALRSRPLWRRPLASRVRIEERRGDRRVGA